jgi:hypothetical protein
VGKLPPGDAVLSILVGLTSNTLSKAVLAVLPGEKAYALEIIPGLIIVIGAAWAGMLLR